MTPARYDEGTIATNHNAATGEREYHNSGVYTGGGRTCNPVVGFETTAVNLYRPTSPSWSPFDCRGQNSVITAAKCPGRLLSFTPVLFRNLNLLSQAKI